MPSYKTHSIHSELIFDSIDRNVKLDKEDLKTFAMGPDTLILPDIKTFKTAHKFKVKDYYELLLKKIKEEKLLCNEEAMAFLYGQIDHYILDAITHPLIYYMTEGETPKYRLDPHGLCEMWIDDYLMNMYNMWEIFYYKKNKINNKEVKKLISDVYNDTYGTEDAGKKYDAGIRFMNAFDTIIRRNLIGVVPVATAIANTGDIVCRKDTTRVEQYINSNHELWYNPETLEEFTDSFMDLFEKSKEVSLETIEDVNRYLYHGSADQ